MATIYYSLSAKRNSNNQQEIMIRFTHGRINQRSKSNLFVEVDYWDDKRSEIIIPRFRIMDPHQRQLRDYLANLQANLDDLSLLIQNSFNELDKTAVPRDWLRTLIDGHNYPDKYLSEEEINRGRDFFELFDLFLSQRRISPVRHDGYLVLKRALQRFELFVQRTSEPTFKLSVEEMDLDTISDIESFLTHEHSLYKEYRDVYDSFPTFGMRRMPAPRPRGNNTLNNLFKMFKAFFNWCYSSEITDNQPFRNYTTKPEVYGTPYYITIEERNRLYELDLSERPKLAVQRDVFVFQCLIGCRVSDLYKLTTSNVIDGAVEYVPRKTREGRPVTVRVPLNTRASEILERYTEAGGSERLLPFVSKQKYNVAIKRMFKLAEITRYVTVLNPTTGEQEQRPLNELASSHLARRTFIGNLYKQVKDPNLVGSLTGHKEGSKAFARYRDIDEEMKRDLVKLLE